MNAEFVVSFVVCIVCILWTYQLGAHCSHKFNNQPEVTKI